MSIQFFKHFQPQLSQKVFLLWMVRIISMRPFNQTRLKCGRNHLFNEQLLTLG